MPMTSHFGTSWSMDMGDPCVKWCEDGERTAEAHYGRPTAPVLTDGL